jgi:HNH endonuclease
MTASRGIYRKRGTGTISNTGHRNIGVNGKKRGEHVLICERILGRRLPAGAEVHHVNNVPSDNRPSNLVICPNRAYHKLLHVRTEAYDACGHADWHKCQHCKSWGLADVVVCKMLRGKPVKWFHRECERKWWRDYYVKRTTAARCKPQPAIERPGPSSISRSELV